MIPRVLLAALAFVNAEAGHSVEVPVTAPSGVSVRIAKDLTLEVRRLPDADGSIGWDVVVRDNRRLSEGNLLYHSRDWHGPYPTMIEPWMVRDHYFPASNDFNVRGYPWRVMLECRNCAVEGSGEVTRLTRGTIRVSWRRR